MREVNTHKIIRILTSRCTVGAAAAKGNRDGQQKNSRDPFFKRNSIHNQKSPYRWFPHSVHIHSTTIQNHSR